MLRSAVLAAVALVAAPALAPAQPATLISFQFVDAKVDKDALTWTQTEQVPVAKEVVVEVVKNGVKFAEKRTVTVYQSVAVTRQADLTKVKATDGGGKAVAAEKLAELLKEPTLIVLASGPVPEKHRKLFREATLFVELPQPDVPKVPAPAGGNND
jgi:hypothetical protein